MKITFFWNVATCSLIKAYPRFKGAYCFYRPDDGSSKPLWNVDIFLSDYTAQHPRRQSSSDMILLLCIYCMHFVQVTHGVRKWSFFLQTRTSNKNVTHSEFSYLRVVNCYVKVLNGLYRLTKRVWNSGCSRVRFAHVNPRLTRWCKSKVWSVVHGRHKLIKAPLMT
jgi:hypothetical protein